MKKVYIAGPDVFRSDAAGYFAYVRDYALSFNLQALIPLDNEAPVSNSEGTLSKNIYEANLKMIRDCDLVIANITPFRGVSLDPGTAFEIGYAKSLGLRVIGFTHDGREYKQRVPNPAPSHPSVEDFGLIENLMIQHSCDGIWRSIESAIQWAAHGRKQ